MTAKITHNGVEVTGHTCPKGEEYAVNECTNPVRTVTAAIPASNRVDTMISVKTDAPVPKGKMMDVIAALRQVKVNAPVAIGDVVLADVFGANVIVTKNVE